jgi:hypothetical protein
LEHVLNLKEPLLEYHIQHRILLINFKQCGKDFLLFIPLVTTLLILYLESTKNFINYDLIYSNPEVIFHAI